LLFFQLYTECYISSEEKEIESATGDNKIGYQVTDMCMRLIGMHEGMHEVYVPISGNAVVWEMPDIAALTVFASLLPYSNNNTHYTAAILIQLYS
jgi:hypothetical protein